MAKPVHAWNYIPVQGYDISSAFGMAQGGINNAVAGMEKWMEVKSEIATGKAMNALAQANDAVEVNNLLKEIQENTWVDNKALGDASSKRKDRFFDEDITEQELAEKLVAGAHGRKMAEGNLSLGWANHGLSAQNSAIANKIAMGRYSMDQAEYQRKLNLIGEDGLTNEERLNQKIKEQQIEKSDFDLSKSKSEYQRKLDLMGEDGLSDDERLDLLLKQQKLEKGDVDIEKVKADTGKVYAEQIKAKKKTEELPTFSEKTIDEMSKGYEFNKKLNGALTLMSTSNGSDPTQDKMIEKDVRDFVYKTAPNHDPDSIDKFLNTRINKIKKEKEVQYRDINNSQVEYLKSTENQRSSRSDSLKLSEELPALSPLIADTDMDKNGQTVLYDAYTRYRKDGNAIDGALLVQHILNSAHNLPNGQQFLNMVKENEWIVDAQTNDNWFFDKEFAKVPASKGIYRELLNAYNTFSNNTNAKNKRTVAYRKSSKKGK